MKDINVMVIGAGLYVCGKGTEGFGTILPAIYEWKRALNGNANNKLKKDITSKLNKHHK